MPRSIGSQEANAPWHFGMDICDSPIDPGTKVATHMFKRHQIDAGTGGFGLEEEPGRTELMAGWRCRFSRRFAADNCCWVKTSDTTHPHHIFGG